jgi:holo-[acyl-carrier protein] synthase
VRVGVDIVEVERIERALVSRGSRFASRVFTEAEIQYCEARRNRFQSYAARFAAKEAVAKLIGTGFTSFAPCDIEVVIEASGRPRIVLHGKARVCAEAAGIGAIEISMSHVATHAVAVAAAEGGEGA